MKSVYDIIKRPIVSESSMSNMQDRKYTFEVALTANKIEIKHAVEKIFPGTIVESVTTSLSFSMKTA